MNGQNWNAIERTDMKDFLFEQDKTGGLNTGQDCRTSHLDRTELEAKRQDRTA